MAGGRFELVSTHPRAVVSHAADAAATLESAGLAGGRQAALNFHAIDAQAEAEVEAEAVAGGQGEAGGSAVSMAVE